MFVNNFHVVIVGGEKRKKSNDNTFAFFCIIHRRLFAQYSDLDRGDQRNR